MVSSHTIIEANAECISVFLSFYQEKGRKMYFKLTLKTDIFPFMQLQADIR